MSLLSVAMNLPFGPSLVELNYSKVNIKFLMKENL